MESLNRFRSSLLSRKVVARYIEALEFSTPEALKKYLQKHPKADPHKHTVRKHKTPTQFKKQDRSRWNDVLKSIQGLKEIGKKAIDGDEEATKEVSKRFNSLYGHGSTLADDAKPLIKKLKGSGKLSEKGKKHLAELEKAVQEWDSKVPKFEKAKGRNPRAQLNWSSEAVSTASDMRTLYHWLQEEAVASKAMKRASELPA